MMMRVNRLASIYIIVSAQIQHLWLLQAGGPYQVNRDNLSQLIGSLVSILPGEKRIIFIL